MIIPEWLSFYSKWQHFSARRYTFLVILFLHLLTQFIGKSFIDKKDEQKMVIIIKRLENESLLIPNKKDFKRFGWTMLQISN